MTRLLRAGAICLCLASAARTHAQELPRSTQRYAITARLDPATHSVTGTVLLQLRNHATRPLTQLYFHLYLNAFRDRGTVFMREGGTTIRGTRLGRPGRIDVLSLRTQAGADLLPGAEHELIAGDRTQLRVPLPAPLAAGGELALHVEFRAGLPEIVARSGYAGTFHMVAQWFPKLAKLEADGRFASFPYHGVGEFYADFADYDLTLTVPRDYVVGASGVRTSSRPHGALRTDTFVARAVHDVAFAAYPGFTRYSARAGGVELELLAPRGYTLAARRQLDLLREGLAYFGARFGRYPYPKLTIIVPPAPAHGATGMEYPTLIVTGGPRWALPRLLPDPVHDLLAAHELAHQWFGGLVATDEVQAPLLDEGLAQWAALDFLRAYYARHCVPLPVGPFEVAAELLQRRGGAVPSSLLPAYRYDVVTLARAVYLRPAVLLDALHRRGGDAAVHVPIGRYARAQRFRHPTPALLLAELDPALARALAGRPSALLRAPEQEPTRLDSLLAPLAAAASMLLQVLGP